MRHGTNLEHTDGKCEPWGEQGAGWEVPTQEGGAAAERTGQKFKIEADMKMKTGVAGGMKCWPGDEVLLASRHCGLGGLLTRNQLSRWGGPMRRVWVI